MVNGTDTIKGLVLTPSVSRKNSPGENAFFPNPTLPTIQLDYLGSNIPRIMEPNDLGPPPTCPVPHSEGRELVTRVIPTDIDTLFSMLFTDSVFFADLHAARKTTDIVLGDWQKSPDGNKEIRTINMTVALNGSVGPKTSKVTETQLKLPVSLPGKMYVVEVEQVNAGIPFADSFYITSHFCMTRLDEGETKLCIVSQIKYKKSVWKTIKVFIEKNTWAGLEEFYTNLANALLEECEKTQLGGQRPGQGGLTRTNTPMRKRRLTKRPAPSVPHPQNKPTQQITPVGSFSTLILKLTLGILVILLVLNAFLYFKLTKFEASSKTVHKDQGELLQEQETLHRLELQKWHEKLMAASKLMQQAADDMQALKFLISSYETEKIGIKLKQGRLPSLETFQGLREDQGPGRESEINFDQKSINYGESSQVQDR